MRCFSRVWQQGRLTETSPAATGQGQSPSGAGAWSLSEPGHGVARGHECSSSQNYKFPSFPGTEPHGVSRGLITGKLSFPSLKCEW